MATKAKTTKEERNYKPAHAANPANEVTKPVYATPKKKKADTLKIVKALVFGPTIAILSLTLVYIAWWGISKAFMALHTVVTAHFIPFVGKTWPVIVAVWAIVALTSVVYYYFVVEQKKKTKKNTSSKSSPKKKIEPEFDPELDIPLDELLEDIDESDFPFMGLDYTNPKFKAVTEVFGPKKEPEFISES